MDGINNERLRVFSWNLAPWRVGRGPPVGVSIILPIQNPKAPSLKGSVPKTSAKLAQEEPAWGVEIRLGAAGLPALFLQIRDLLS